MVQPRRTSAMPGDAHRPIKICTVGDGLVGKTCLLMSYIRHEFPKDYVPTVFDNYADNIELDGQNYNMMLWDTAGQEDYERLRPLSYPGTQCFLLCFSIDSRASYENIASKWTPEIRHHCPEIPIILVGTKSDLREDDSKTLLTEQDGKKMKRKIKAIAYLECSAKEMTNLDVIFITAVRAAINTSHPKRTHNCTVL